MKSLRGPIPEKGKKQVSPLKVEVVAAEAVAVEQTLQLMMVMRKQ